MEKRKKAGTSLAVQWVRLHASTSGGMGSIPAQGTKIPHATPHNQKKKKKSRVRGIKRAEGGGSLQH